MGTTCSCRSSEAAHQQQSLESHDETAHRLLNDGCLHKQEKHDSPRRSVCKPDAELFRSEATTEAGTSPASVFSLSEDRVLFNSMNSRPSVGDLPTPKTPMLLSTEFPSTPKSNDSPEISKVNGNSKDLKGGRCHIRLKITVQRDSLEEALGLDVEHIFDRYLQVVDILPDGAAADSDLRIGDIIRFVNGVGTSCHHMIRESMFREDLTFEVLRPLRKSFDCRAFLTVQHPPVPRLDLPEIAPEESSGSSP